MLLVNDYTPKLCDFGLTELKGKTSASSASTITAVNDDDNSMKMCGGTPSYMAPELLDLKNTISSKTDCYSFGILLVSFSFKCFLKLQVSATIQLKSTNQKIILYPLEE